MEIMELGKKLVAWELGLDQVGAWEIWEELDGLESAKLGLVRPLELKEEISVLESYA